jgi:hypothetical protein
MPDDDKKSPLDTLVELGLYAPLGLALAARDSLPDLIARGRQQVTSQVALARMMGHYAVKEGEKDLRKRVEDVSGTLSALGLLPEPNPTPAPAPAAAHVPTPPPEAEVVVEASTPAAAASNGSSNGSANGKAQAAAPVVSRADLAIPGYDTLSASQVVQRLAGLTADELEAVRDYESGTRGRRTILSKIGQLQTGSST